MRKPRLGSSVVIIFGVGLLAFFTYHEMGPKREAIKILGEDSSNLQAYRSLAEEFTSLTGINIQFEGVTFEQSIQKADAMFRNGGSDFDIVLQYNFSLAPYVRNHYVAEIGDYISPSALNNSHITEGMLTNALKETCYYYSDPLDSKSSPKQFGFPFAANTMLLVYNKDIFENSELMSEFKTLHDKTLAPPTKFSELLEISEFISSSNLGFHGICLQGASDGWLYYELCNFLFGMGTGTSQKWYGWQEDAPLTISTPKNVEVLNYYKRLYQTTTGDYYTVGASQQREIMLDGKTAMCLMWSDYLLPLAQSKEIRFGFLPIPGNVSGLAGGAFYLNKNSAHIEAASQFILYALTPETQERLLKAGLCSAQRLAYTSDVQRAVPYANALLTSLERGVFMFEAGTDAEIISSEITTWVQKFIRGEVSAEIALKKAQAEISTKKTKMNI